MTQDKKPSRRGELQRRWREMLEDGSLAALRSEGRLMALYVLHNADWATCEVRFSMRRAARAMRVQPTTVRRGVAQLVDAKVVEVLGKPEGSGKTRFVVGGCARAVRTPDTSRAQGRARVVRTPDTSGAQSGHEPCAERARAVRGARTPCARNSFLFSGSSLTTTETPHTATPVAGQGPAKACRVTEDECSAPAGDVA